MVVDLEKEPGFKRCGYCDKVKALTQFSVTAYRKCKSCKSAANKLRYAQKTEKQLSYVEREKLGVPSFRRVLRRNNLARVDAEIAAITQPVDEYDEYVEWSVEIGFRYKEARREATRNGRQITSLSVGNNGRPVFMFGD